MPSKIFFMSVFLYTDIVIPHHIYGEVCQTSDQGKKSKQEKRGLGSRI